MIDHRDPKAEYDFTPRDPSLCPHCGKTGYRYDGYTLGRSWGPPCHDDVYLCASGEHEWIMRSYRYAETDLYPGPVGALIYIPEKTRANEGQHGGETDISVKPANKDIPF